MSRNSRSSREEVLKRKAEDEARRNGTLPAEKDEHGRIINPHIPEFMKMTPWYAGDVKVSLDHQRLPESQKEVSDIHRGWYERGTSRKPVSQDFIPGSCTNCGATTHTAKNCLEKPHKLGAERLGKRLAPDDREIKDLKLSYDGKRDIYNGYNPEEQLKLAEKRLNISKATPKQAPENTKNEVLQNTSLRVRSDLAKYLRNLDPDSAFYDPKTRSMRANPTPHLPLDQVSFAGDNFVRNSGEANELEKLEAFASMRSASSSSDSNMIHTTPTALNLAKKEFEERKAKLAAEKKRKIEDQYGKMNAPPPRNLPASSSSYSEWANDGTILKGAADIPVSRFEEDQLEGNHTQVWGSYFDPATMSWGFGCCLQTIRKSYCTGDTGKNAVMESKSRNELYARELEDNRTALEGR